MSVIIKKKKRIIHKYSVLFKIFIININKNSVSSMQGIHL